MGLFTRYKLQYGHYKLNKQLRTFERSKRVHNFESARAVGILSPANTNDSFEQVLELAHFLSAKNIDVSVLVFCQLKEVPQSFLLRRKINVFNIKEVNWYGKPMVTIAEDFINREFDILIDLSLMELFPVKWIASLSKSKFKVGALNYLGCPNDLIMNVGRGATLNYLIEQLKYYLNYINNRFAQEKQLVANN